MLPHRGGRPHGTPPGPGLRAAALRVDSSARCLRLHHAARRPQAPSTSRRRLSAFAVTARPTTAPRIQAAIDKAGTLLQRRAGVHALRPLPADAHHLCLARRAPPRLRRDAAGVRPRRTTRRASRQGMGVMVMFTRRRARPRRPRRRAARRVPFPPPGSVPPERPDRRRQPGHVLSGDEQHRLRDRPRQPGGGRDPLPCRAARHPQPHELPTSDSGLAALTQIGNEAQDLHFRGGRYGILTENTSPYWPFTLRRLGLRRPARRRHPRAHGRPHRRPHHVPQRAGRHRDRPRLLGPAVGEGLALRERLAAPRWSSATRRTPMTQVGFENAVCAGVPVFARFRESGKTVAGRGADLPRRQLQPRPRRPARRHAGEIDTRYDAAPLARLPAPPPPAIRALPPHRRLGQRPHARREGRRRRPTTPRRIRKAIDTHRVLYFPTGYYIVRDTITLKPDTVADRAPSRPDAARSPGLARPATRAWARRRRCSSAPQGGTQHRVSGLGHLHRRHQPARDRHPVDGRRGLAAGRHAVPRLRRQRACRRRCGRRSIRPAAGARQFAAGRWGAQYPSLWVTRGGGGTFNNIWSPNTFAQSGLLRLRHDDAWPRLPTVGRASSVRRDQARSRRELGLQRAADRRGSRRPAPRRWPSRSTRRRTSRSPTTTAIA